MASEVVTHGITYRSTDYVTFSGTQLRFCLRLVSGLYAGIQVRGTDVIVPGLAGRISQNRLLDRRLIEVEGFVQGIGSTEDARRDDFEAAMATLMNDFDPTLAAGSLVVHLQGGGTASIEARTLPETIEGQATIPSRLDIAFRLEAVGSDWAVVGS